MPTADLPTAPTPLPRGGLRAVLRSLGAPDAYGNPAPPRTGKLAVRDRTTGREGALYLRAGRVYAAELGGFVPPVAARMRSAGLVEGDSYQFLARMPAALVGQGALDAGYATDDDVEDINRQWLLATVTLLYNWAAADFWWVPDAETTEFTIAGLEANLVVTAADERVGTWNILLRGFPGATKGSAVPRPGPDWDGKTGSTTTPEIAAVLAHVDGVTTVSQIASSCGFTRFEIAARLAKAVADGILIVPDPDGSADPASTPAGLDPDNDGLDPKVIERDEAAAAVEQARGWLASAEARLARAEAALQERTTT